MRNDLLGRNPSLQVAQVYDRSPSHLRRSRSRSAMSGVRRLQPAGMRQLRTLASSREADVTAGDPRHGGGARPIRSDPERRHGLGMLKRRAGRVDAI